MDKILDWALAQLSSKKFWAFASSVLTVAAGYFTGQVEASVALQSIVLAALIWLGLYGGDVVRAKFK